MNSNRKNTKQSFQYRGRTYKYRITEAALKRASKKLRLSVRTMICGSMETQIRVLFECVCWEGNEPEAEEFVKDWRSGLIFGRWSRNERSFHDLKRLMLEAAKRYRLF